jgi:predicted pyridoxine 5'-phosphate oxidase superfamily flavin-nucleotide-binding protein
MAEPFPLDHSSPLPPGSNGEHKLQHRFQTVGRALAFYDRQVLHHLNPLMREFISRQEMMFIATADARGECDCSFRAGPPGFVRVLGDRFLMYPEYRGNGVLASLGNIVENAHVGLFFADFFDSTVGLHVNGTAELRERQDLKRTLSPAMAASFLEQAAGPRCERWVLVTVEEAYIHCSKHIPALSKREKTRHWGTDDPAHKGGDYFGVRATMVRPTARQATAQQPTARPTAGGGRWFRRRRQAGT